MADKEVKEDKKGRGQPTKGLDALVEFMGENNRATSEIEKDQRNTRRHLLEMKKLDIGAVELQERMNSNFENFFETMNAGKLDAVEADSEQLALFQEIRDGINNQADSGGAAAEKAGKSTMKGMGKLLGGAGIGVGVAGLGIAAVIGAGSMMLSKLEEIDAQKISDNVGILSKMGSDNENFLKDGGKVAIVLTGLGIGLAAFGLGSGVASAVDHFQKDGWAQKIADNVGILTGIADLKFADTAEVVAVLTGLGLGLAAFGVGSFFANASSKEQGEEIRTAVSDLLRIAEDPNADPARAELAVNALTSLGGGLTSFGVGSFFANASSEGQGEAIRQEVASLLSIADDPNANLEDISRATGALAALGAGLAAFGGGSFVGSLAGAASSVLDFMSGNESPLSQAKDLGNNADLIDSGVESFGRFREELNRFSEMGKISGDLGLTEMASDLVGASELIRLAVEGGEIDDWGFNTKVKGLANIEGLDEAIAKINDLKEALGLTPSNVGIQMSADSAANAEASSGGGDAVITSVGGTTNEGSTQATIINYAPMKVSRIDTVLASR